MDREAKEEYHVVIQAKDMGGHMGGLSGTTRVTITLTDVNDNSAKFPQSKESKLVFDNDHCSARASSFLSLLIYPAFKRKSLEIQESFS
jgi:cadherin 11 type 2 (OB-cadherin)